MFPCFFLFFYAFVFYALQFLSKCFKQQAFGEVLAAHRARRGTRGTLTSLGLCFFRSKALKHLKKT